MILISRGGGKSRGKFPLPSPPRVIGQIKSAASVLADDRGSRLINIYPLIEVRMYTTHTLLRGS